MNEYTTLPVARFYPDQIVLYNVTESKYPRSFAQKENEKNLTRGQYNGYMSPKTKSKVKKYLSTWINGIAVMKKSTTWHGLEKKPYLTFVTLTLPSVQAHPDNLIKRKCLAPFIDVLKAKYDVREYFWRAEAQKNGNIHFHIIIDSFIDHVFLRKEWNRVIEKLSYVSIFEKKHGHRDPNSTDIHGLRNIRRIEAYVIKYCCKSDGNRKIEGRVHGCSDGLRCLRPYECLIDQKVDEIIDKAVNDPKSKVFTADDFTIIKCNVSKLLQATSPRYLELYKENFSESIKLLYGRKEPPNEVKKIEEKITTTLLKEKKPIQQEIDFTT